MLKVTNASWACYQQNEMTTLIHITWFGLYTKLHTEMSLYRIKNII